MSRGNTADRLWRNDVKKIPMNPSALFNKRGFVGNKMMEYVAMAYSIMYNRMVMYLSMFIDCLMPFCQWSILPFSTHQNQ